MKHTLHVLIGATAMTAVGGFAIQVLLLDSSPAVRVAGGGPFDHSVRPLMFPRFENRMMAGSSVEVSLRRLESASDEDFSEKLGRIVSAWDDSTISGDVHDLFMRPVSGPMMEELRSALLRRWASMEPAEAGHWAMSLARETDRACALDHVMVVWSAADPGATFEWVKSQPDEPVRNQAWAMLAYEVSRDHPSMAYEMALPFAGTPMGVQCMEHAIANWALQDPQAALARVRDLVDVPLRNKALASLATSWAESDSVAAAALVSESMEPGPAQERAVASIVQRWAQQDPKAAESWVASFSEGSMKDQAILLIKEQTSIRSGTH